MDPFSRQARQYVLSRPNYPSMFIGKILSKVPNSKAKRCLDVACGSGQLTAQLADHFEHIVGIDRSEAQLAHAVRKDNITYERIKDATDLSHFKEASFDCVTIAQGLHWLPLEATLKEFHRVLKPGGIFVAMGYAVSSIGGPAQVDFRNYYDKTLGTSLPFGTPGNWWPCDRQRLDTAHGHETFDPPFTSVERIWKKETKEATVREFMEYLVTWSGYQALKATNPKEDPLVALEAKIREKSGAEVEVTVPFWLITAQKSPSSSL